MSTKKKGKSTAAAKRKRTVPAHDAALDGPSGRFWRLSIESGQTAHIANNVSLYAVIQNRGPGMIGVPIRDDGALLKLIPGGLWVVPVLGALSVENMASKPALIQIEFLPKFK